MLSSPAALPSSERDRFAPGATNNNSLLCVNIEITRHSDGAPLRLGTAPRQHIDSHLVDGYMRLHAGSAERQQALTQCQNSPRARMAEPRHRRHSLHFRNCGAHLRDETTTAQTVSQGGVSRATNVSAQRLAANRASCSRKSHSPHSLVRQGPLRINIVALYAQQNRLRGFPYRWRTAPRHEGVQALRVRRSTACLQLLLGGLRELQQRCFHWYTRRAPPHASGWLAMTERRVRHPSPFKDTFKAICD